MIYLCDISNVVEKHEYKSNASFVGRLLLKYALLQKGINLDEYIISYNENGKPYIKGIKYHFNISHSANIVCVVIDENLCGIDVEIINSNRKFDKIVDSYFDQVDKDAYYNLNDDKRVAFFYTIWVQIETYIKKLGSNMINAKKIGYERYTVISIKDFCGNSYSLSSSTNEINVNIIDFNDLM